MLLFFDTETTGLAKFNLPEDSTEQPRLVQLAFIKTEDDGTIIHEGCFIIKPDGFEIPTFASDVHGITTEYAIEKGTLSENVLSLFEGMFAGVTKLIAHNIKFDRCIIISELKRYVGYRHPIWQNKDFCTMLESTPICRIKGPKGYKWPKLQEAYTYFFGHPFDNAHDALADVKACKDVYFAIQKHNNKFNVGIREGATSPGTFQKVA
jgi:DNA polymerase III epsilon subunit-like protein